MNERNASGMSEMAIPPLLHFIWVGSPMPGRLAANVHAWGAMHPAWDVKVWTEREIDEIGLQNRALYDQADKTVPRDAVEQFRADIVRYEILALYGGFYADVDTRPLRPIDSALAGLHEFAAAEDRNWVGNTVLGCIPGHRVMQQLVAQLAVNVTVRRGSRPNKLSGPQYLTPIWRKYGAHVDPTELWYPYSYRDVINGTIPTDLGDAYIEHQWHHTRSILRARGRNDV